MRKLLLCAVVLSICSLSQAGVDDDPMLLGWWTFENVAKLGEDSSGHQYHGSIIGAPQASTDVPMHLWLNQPRMV